MKAGVRPQPRERGRPSAAASQLPATTKRPEMLNAYQLFQLLLSARLSLHQALLKQVLATHLWEMDSQSSRSAVRVISGEQRGAPVRLTSPSMTM